MEPARLQIRADAGRGSWVRLLWIPLRSPDCVDTWLVHCALDASREHEVEQYLSRLASRTTSAQHGSTDWRKLTTREREILAHLARDHDLPTIAARLHLSRTTVRNHVQHILEKTESHSVQELVARYLLAGADKVPGRTGCEEQTESGR